MTITNCKRSKISIKRKIRIQNRALRTTKGIEVGSGA